MALSGFRLTPAAPGGHGRRRGPIPGRRRIGLPSACRSARVLRAPAVPRLLVGGLLRPTVPLLVLEGT